MAMEGGPAVFSPGRFGVSGRYSLRAEGISADTPCVCRAPAQLINYYARSSAQHARLFIPSARGNIIAGYARYPRPLPTVLLVPGSL